MVGDFTVCRMLEVPSFCLLYLGGRAADLFWSTDGYLMRDDFLQRVILRRAEEQSNASRIKTPDLDELNRVCVVPGCGGEAEPNRVCNSCRHLSVKTLRLRVLGR